VTLSTVDCVAPPDVRPITGYAKYRCRCQRCHDAMLAVDRAAKARRKQRAAEAAARRTLKRPTDHWPPRP
jgi:hypothetical protein